MISYAEIRNAYNKLYAEMRRYIWGFSIVVLLADIEIESYKTCPDVATIRNLLRNLSGAVLSVSNQDPDLKKAIDTFMELVRDEDTAYAKIHKVSEVVPQ